MIIDIDFFKQVNDNYGHSVGDMTLKQFAGIIRGNFTDGRAVVGRWGGEEFVTICYDMDIRKLKEVAEELREKVAAETFKAVGHITCSIGITGIKLEDEADFVFERMDKALYEAKSDGRNCTRCIEA
jgi:diguanylate cyclase (GGDEF)-like protein